MKDNNEDANDAKNDDISQYLPSINMANVSVILCVCVLPWEFLVGFATWAYYGDNKKSRSVVAAIYIAAAIPGIFAVLFGALAAFGRRGERQNPIGILGLIGGLAWCAYFLYGILKDVGTN